MDQFLYFITVSGNNSHLKADLANYPNLALSFSKQELFTFKNKGKSLSAKEIRDLKVDFALAQGEVLGLLDSKLVLEAIQQKIVSTPLSIFLVDLSGHFQTLEQKTTIKEAQAFILIKEVGPDKFMLGYQLKDRFQSPPIREFYSMTEDENLPSRAYHKLKQAFYLLNFQDKKALSCVDFGCAPGGSSYYLLENEHKVVGIDPGQMDERVMQNKLFKFKNRPMQTINRLMLPKEIDILISDVNLPPKMVLRQFRRIFENNSPPLALITLKISTPEQLADRHIFIKILDEMGYSKVDFVQLPAHRKEFLAIASRRNYL